MKEIERNNKKNKNCVYFTSFCNNLLASYPVLKQNRYTYLYVLPTMISCYIIKPSELTTIVSVISILTLNHPYNKTTIDNLTILYNMIKDTTIDSSYFNVDAIDDAIVDDTIDTIENEENSDNSDNNENNSNENNSKEEFDTTININIAYKIGEELISNDDYVILDN